MDQEYINYLKSPKWKAIKLRLIQIRGNKCERCGNRGFVDAHHKTYKHIFNEPLEDLELLCRKCHNEEHNKKSNKQPIKTNLKPIQKSKDGKVLKIQMKNENIVKKCLEIHILITLRVNSSI